MIVITHRQGLCGGLNTNLLRPRPVALDEEGVPVLGLAWLMWRGDVADLSP